MHTAIYQAVFVVVSVVSIDAGEFPLVRSLSVRHKAIIPWYLTVSRADVGRLQRPHR